VVLASVALALAIYQLVLIAVAYGKLRPSFLDGRPAGRAHRASGDAIAVVLLIVAAMCVSLFGFEDDAGLHIASGTALLVVLALKIGIVRYGGRASRLLPLLGVSVFALVTLTWLTSAGSLLARA
jgi:hypothetical protein